MINVNEMDSNTIMLGVLNLIDVVMIANLLVMVTIGGYEIFVSKLRTRNHPDQPEWMSHVNATVLKVKTFYVYYRYFIYPYAANLCECEQYARKTMMWQLLLHLGFLASAIAMHIRIKFFIVQATNHINKSKKR